MTLLATFTVGSRQFYALEKKIDALEVMMDIKIEMIKQDLAMVVKNVTMSVIGELQGTNGNINTFQIANTMGEDPKSKIQAAEDVNKVIQRGFSSEKMALKKSFSIIEQSVSYVQSQLEDVKEDLADIARNVMTKSETLTQLQLINAEINKNKNDIEAKVMKNVNDVKKDLADIVGRFMIKSEALAKFQLVNTEINKNKNDIEAKVDKAKLAPILKSIDDCKTSNSKFASFTTHKYGNSIYFKLNSSMDFYDGRRECQKYGATLPEVTSSGENDFFTSTFSKYGEMFLGATNHKLKSHFLWDHSGQFVMYTNWHHEEPNDFKRQYPTDNYDGEDCLEIQEKGNHYRWNDIKCIRSKIIVCEFECELDI
ncbi:hypothetical protein DPMN_100949 [Dreissena polymorpha]|uniref:C-type lectin domain-containing protein n=2 Tax=Dreissena polymorpha TaxID=45954 RepID=A0A9D4LK64_DREPO|nr:hypothetical protein DPMN_100949 [Dreissena polymorpha]